MKISLAKNNSIVLLQNRLLARMSFLDALKGVSGSQLGNGVLVSAANIERRYRDNKVSASSK